MKRVKHFIFWLVVIGLVLLLFSSHVIAENDFYRQRYALVEIIKAEVMDTREFLNQKSLDQRVIDALLKVPRHEFVPDSERPYAYKNRPLSIGFGQTISQPYIVAKMTELLLEASTHLDNVLEIGTGCGYQTAILAQLVGHVYSIERILLIHRKSKSILWDLKL